MSACTDAFMMMLFGYFGLLLLVLCARIKCNGLLIVMVSTTLAFVTVSGRLHGLQCSIRLSVEF